MIKDKDGVKLQYPDRCCFECKKYPCMNNMESFKCDFAKYGCKDYTC